MISYTQHDLQNRTLELQELAKQHPVLIQTGETKQVLLSYADYQKMAGNIENEPLQSASDFLLQLGLGLTDEELEILVNSDVEFDMSLLS